MPEKIVCSHCGFVFYEGDDLVSPEVIAKRYGYRCPRCAAPLKVRPLNLKITPSRKRRRR
ncbi:MAG: hypothetical protein J7J99_05685 [Thermoprotei archaeon]|nr:hypothetical protein [Thermoprotei archaeon]